MAQREQRSNREKKKPKADKNKPKGGGASSPFGAQKPGQAPQSKDNGKNKR